MLFDPSVPRPNTPPRSGEIRDNFNALKSLIDAAPAGPPGPAGADGRSIVDVYDSGDGTGRAIVRMSDDSTYGPFTIASGPAGSNGADSTVPGPEGPAGPEGRHVTNVRDNGDGRAVVDMSDGGSYGPFSVASGPAGQQGERGSDGGQGPGGPEGRHVTNVRDSGDGRAIVDMSDGTSYGPFSVAGGPQGPQGNDGAQGQQGPPGEVTSQQLSDAIGGTSNNTNTVQTLDSSFADADMETLRQKLNELIGALRR